MAIVYTESEIAARFNVTQEQIDRASRVLDCHSGKVFYQVESQTTENTTYEVRYNAQFQRLTCNCPAGNPPIDERTGDPLYAPRNCWHKRAASASAFEYRQAENLQARKEAEAVAEHAEIQASARAKVARLAGDLETRREEARTSVAGLNPGKGVQQAKPFSLLK